MKNIFVFGCIWVLILNLTGCAVGPDYSPAKPTQPDNWSSWHGGSPELMAAQQRADQAPQTAKSNLAILSDPKLEQLLARVLTDNLDVKTAALRLTQSRVQRNVASAQHQPQLKAEGGVHRQRQSESGASTRMIDAIAPPQGREELIDILSSPFSLYQAGFDASWEVDFWGRVRRSVEAADAELGIAQASVKQVHSAVQAELARNYFELRGVQNQLRITRADIVRSETSLELLQAINDGGLSSDFELTQQKIQLDDLRSRLPGLLVLESQALNQISLLLGEQPGSLALELADSGEWVLPTLPDLSLGIPSDVAHNRPDILASEAQLRAATANIGIATADLYPRIMLGANFGFESVASEKFGEWGSHQWSVGPGFSLPIFDQGKRRAFVKLRKLKQQEAAVMYQQTLVKAWHEIDATLTQYNAEQSRLQQLENKLNHSRNNYELVQEKKQSGLVSDIPLLEAQRSYLQAQREYSESSVRIAIILVAIDKALGFGAFYLGPNEEHSSIQNSP